MKKFLYIFLCIILCFGISCGAKNKKSSKNHDVGYINREQKTKTKIDNNFFKDLKDRTFEAYVEKVYDGDTITVNHNNKKIKVRLYGIDAPEATQEYGQQSRQELANIILNKNVTILVKDIDKYGRVVGEVYYGKNNMNIYLLEKGAVWFYEYHAGGEDTYKNAYETAKSNKIGLWKNPKALNPRTFRQNHK